VINFSPLGLSLVALMPVIPAPKGLRQEAVKPEATQGYIVRHCLKKNKSKNNYL
jgi:hypothetical protein